MILLAQETEKN